ncbi:hypothetical protein HDU67_009120 [Dinochytrium kinnereticum]|nr:hypothetical protein HDU67_009120 [Dinochytrium kinnereticum]
MSVGVDIIHLPRIHALLQRTSPLRFARKILAVEEVRQFQQRFKRSLDVTFEQSDSFLSSPVEEQQISRYLGGRWALKEATYKACFPDLKPTWKQVTIISDRGKPMVEFKGGPKLNASLSHDGEYAMAAVILFGKPITASHR